MTDTILLGLVVGAPIGVAVALAGMVIQDAWRKRVIRNEWKAYNAELARGRTGRAVVDPEHGTDG